MTKYTINFCYILLHYRVNEVFVPEQKKYDERIGGKNVSL